MDIHILQGEAIMARDNMSLGRFRIEDIPPVPDEVPKIEFTFDIDVEGIIHVTAQDKVYDKKYDVITTASINLSKSEIDRMVKAANGQTQQEKQQHEAAERREADWKKQQRAAARQPRTVPPPPPITPPQSATTITHHQEALHSTNVTTSSIAPLSPINPLDHLRLLWWTLVMPQQLKAYRQQYGENAERSVSKWLVSTLIWLPFLLLTLALNLRMLPRASGTYYTAYLLIMLTGWCFTVVFGDRGYYQAKGVVGALKGVVRVGVGVNLVTFIVIDMVGKLAVPLGRELWEGLVTGLLVALGGGILVELGIKPWQKPWVGIWAGIWLGLWAGSQFGVNIGFIVLSIVIQFIPLSIVIERSLKIGRPSWLARGAFGVLVTAYLFLVWFCFLGGWQVLAQ